MTIRVVWGTGTGPTEMAAYDAALADANVHNYNLVAVSSVIPADAAVEVAGTAPDLGPVGDRLTVVEAHATATGSGRVSAALAWASSPDGGLFYEAAGPTRGADAEGRATEGLEAGMELRDWAFGEPSVHVETAATAPDSYTTVVTLAVYGTGEPAV